MHALQSAVHYRLLLPPLLHNLHRYTLSDRLGVFYHERIRSGCEHIHIECYSHIPLNDALSKKQISHLLPFSLIHCENIVFDYFYKINYCLTLLRCYF